MGATDTGRDAQAPGDSGSPNPPDLFRSIVAKADEGVLILEPDRLISYANPAAEFLLARKRDELVGEMFGLPLSASDKPVRVNVLSGDGCLRVVELRIEPLPTGPGGSIVLRLKDITAYHQEAASAREQVRRRDEFLAMLSHELRNPLAAIQGAALLLTREDVDPPARRQAGEIFNRQFRHLARMLEDLLDVTRVSRGKLELKKERVELTQVIRDAIAAAAPLIRKREHMLRVDIPPGELSVWGDTTRLEQVVVNLLHNAAKFTPPNGSLALAVTAGPGEVALCVRDNGPGIPENLLPHVFEPFVQGRQMLDRGEGGLGLGLTLAHTIVGLHGGSIVARPNGDGPGVTFTVRLPLLEAGTSRPPGGPRAGRMRRLLILLVEDNEDTRRVLRQALEQDGHEILEAGDGLGGLAALIERRPDVALVDIGLPGLDGYELARRARQHARGATTRLIAVTGYGMPGDIQAARAAGFDGHLIKPLHYPDLYKLLEEGRADGTCDGGPP
jgi:signal transduction histidine kinase/CheY-like chemotaxis protein